MQGKVSEVPQIHTARQDLCQIQPLSFCPPISYAPLYIACSQFSPSISEGRSLVGVYCRLEDGLACIEGDGQRDGAGYMARGRVDPWDRYPM